MSKKTVAFFPWIIFSLGAMFYCYEYLLRMSPSVMTNVLMSDFSIDAAVLGNLIAYYYYLYTPMQLPVGVLMDRYGPQRLLIFACLTCIVGALWFASTHNVQSLGYSRLLIGFGSAFAFVGVLKIASLWLPENRFALAGGLAMLLGMAGPIMGDNIVPALVNNFGWRQATVYQAYAGIGLAILITVLMRTQPRHKKSKQVLPETTFRQLWPEIIILIKNPFIWINGIVGGLMYLPLSAFAEFWGVPFLRTSYHMDRASAGSAISMVFLGVAMGAPLIGFFSDYIRRRRIIVVIGGLLSSILGFVIVFLPIANKELLYLVLLFFGVFSAVQNLVFPIGREISPDNLAGTAVSVTNTLVMLGGVIFLPLIGHLLKNHCVSSQLVTHHLPVYNCGDYQYALFLVPLALLLGTVLMFFMPETYGKVGQSHVNN